MSHHSLAWLLAWTAFAIPNYLGAAETFPRIPPTPADQAEATFEVLHGFRMELIAAEPLVASPVDMAYDEDGRAYVVEMRDYPYPEEKNAAPTDFPGTVRLLEDTDGDGKFDRSEIFADQLAWPTSVCCWKGGAFVAAAPDIWYFKDTDGNRQADVRRKVFTGFSRYNVQAIMNSLRLGLDGKIYGAAAGNGGNIRHAERASEAALSLSRRDFRFDPATERIEATSGGERYGATFDDWGNRFLCNIRNPVQHVVLPLHYLARNPQLIVPSAVHDAAESGDQLRVFRLSPPEPWRVFRAQRWALDGTAMPRSELIGAGYWTSSSGVTVYRGGAYPRAFRGNVFIGEVAGNLVHRQKLERRGVTFQSTRADHNTEFIRSRDNWFRPVNFVNAPDGTLHVLDMYRETIEHPWSIPDDIKAQLDLTSGKERGRIYRVVPPNFVLPKPPRLSQATTAELVAHLESPHGWWRDTAQRLLLERQDRSAVESLRGLVQQSQVPQARLHALYSLHALSALTRDELLRALQDAESDVVRHGALLAEPQLNNDTALRDAVATLVKHDDAAVRMQVAFSLGQLTELGVLQSGLLQLAARDGNDPWMRTAILSSAGPVIDGLAVALLQGEQRRPKDNTDRSLLVRELAAMIGAQGSDLPVRRLLAAIADSQAAPALDLQFAALAGLGQGLARRKEKLADHLSELDSSARATLDRRLQEVILLAADASAHSTVRQQALELLAYLPWQQTQASLLASLNSTAPLDVQRTALRVLGTLAEPEIGGLLVARWRRLTPPLREQAITVLLSRATWHEPLVAALEGGAIPVAQIPLAQRARLAATKEPVLAERAKKVLAAHALGSRKDVIERYQASLQQPADAASGAIVYRRECANCHLHGSEGHDVGPGLATIQHRSPQEILIHVLDPNREVSPNYLDYAVRLSDGRVLTGLIAAESDSGLTLRRAEKQEDAILRSEIEEIAASGKSLMPEGLEQKISPQEMADLIAFLRQSPTTP